MKKLQKSKEMKKSKVGQYLKEIVTGFVIDKKINSTEAKNFILKLIDKMEMTLITLHVNDFNNGGFDIFCGIKESCIYFGYWHENNYVRIFCSSCKRFENDKIAKYIKRFFKLKHLTIEIINDCPIEEEVARLCLKNI